LENIIADKNGLTKLRNENLPLYMTVVLHAVTDLLEALKFIHDKGYVHGDIKGDNVAFHLGSFCVTDLDCAVPIGSHVTHRIGTPLFMHPITASDPNFCSSPKHDIYALGILLKILLNDKNIIQKKEAWKEKNFSEIDRINLDIYSEASAKPEKTLPALKIILDEMKTRTIRTRLEYIADRMTSINPANIPSVEELLLCFDELKQSLFKHHRDLGTPEEQEAELQTFYYSLIPTQFLSKLNPSIESPIKSRGSSCVSPVSFFGSLSPRLSNPNSSQDLTSAAFLNQKNSQKY
jgi:serine/threonine protein kinase